MFKPESIFLNHAVLDDKMTKDVLMNCHSVKSIIINNDQIKDEIKHFIPSLFHLYKKRLYLTDQKGKFLKKCPGTKDHVCCGYKILNIGDGCNYDCKFCALQIYVNKPFISIYTNLDDLETELKEEFERHSEKIYRIGTGELTDSLSLEEINHYSERLLPIFKGYNNGFLELKTKSINIGFLLKKKAQENIIVSFSLNSAKMAELCEDYAPNVFERIKAAKRCLEHGYYVGFHFDPIIYYKGWFEDYKKVIDYLFKNIKPDRIAWISLGAFRFQPGIKRIINERFPASDIVSGEFILGDDNKMRYFKPIRLELFERIYSLIKSYDARICVYLCMESPDVWKKALKIVMMNTHVLSQILDYRALEMLK
ncbi:hypothetical protein KKB18_07900 [bacterium]|nr:hypothetical protein [bacterium]